jgi:hypothetical protein
MEVLPVPRGPANRCACDTVELDGVSQRLHHVRRPDHLAKVLRAMGAVES